MLTDAHKSVLDAWLGLLDNYIPSSHIFSVTGIWFPNLSDYETVSITSSSISGVGDRSVDDTSALQSFIDANRGKIISIPAGFKIRTTSRILMPENTPIIGGGYSSEIWFDFTGSGSCLVNENNVNGGDSVFVFKDITLRGANKGGLPLGEAAGITGPIIKRASKYLLHRVLITEFHGVSCPFQGVSEVVVYDSHIRKSGRGGFVGWQYTDPMTDVYILFSSVKYCGDDCFALQGGQAADINGQLVYVSVDVGSTVVTIDSGVSLTEEHVGKELSIYSAGDDLKPLITTITSVVSPNTCIIADVSQMVQENVRAWLGFERTARLYVMLNDFQQYKTPGVDNLGRGGVLKGTTGALVAANNIRDTNGYGLFIQQESQTDLLCRGLDNYAYFNTITNAGQMGGESAIAIGRNGIDVRNTDNTRLGFNTVTNSYGDDLYSLGNRGLIDDRNLYI